MLDLVPKWVKITVIIILILLIVYFIGKRAGKAVFPDAVEIPDDRPGTGTKQFNPGGLTDALESDIYGYWPRNMQPYQDLLQLSDAGFVTVYNDWNKRYHKKHSETLRQAMAAEIYMNKTPIKTIFQRMDRLNLS